MPLFSFLLPTRNRRNLVYRFLQSVVDTTHRIDEIEVILCVDEDDPESQNIQFEPLAIQTVTLPPGATMGELNRRAFDASRGRFVMLINDDVVLRTKNWDREIYSVFVSFGDDIGLIHVNDLLFREKLCTFPILSRIACLEIGLCPLGYRRYRIDDHIYDIYNILALLGYRRIVYLPDVVFEHLNHQSMSVGVEEKFISEEGKVYIPNPEILEADANLFDSSMESRKQDAIKLASLVERLRAEQKQSHFVHLANTVKDRFGYRRPDFVQVRRMGAASERSEHATVTVAVVTSNLYEPHAQKCLSLLKKHTHHFDLIILDNNGSENFNHPREMNRAIRLAKTDFLVLMDDDVFVDEGWLDGLLKSIDADTGVISPLHKDKDGKLSHSGVYLMGDEWGTHAHFLDVPERPRVSQCLCSACLFIDVRKVRDVHFDERYSKYFLDLDYSFKVWEAGYKVVCTPYSTVTHIGGATMPHGSPASVQLWNRDIQIFASDWIQSGRLENVRNGMFSRFPFLLLLNYIPHRVRSIFQDDNLEFGAFVAQVAEIESLCEQFPLFQRLLCQEVTRCFVRCTERDDTLKARFCKELVGRLKDASPHASGPIPLLVGSYRGYNLVEYLNEVFAVPRSLGPLKITTASDREQPGVLSAVSVGAVKSIIDDVKGGGAESDIFVEGGQWRLEPNLVLEGYKLFNVIVYGDKYYAILQADGAFDPVRLANARYSCVLCGDSLNEVKSLIDRMPLIARTAFRLKPILIKYPFIWRTAQRVNKAFVRGGVA